MSFENLVREISEIEEDIIFLKGVKNDFENSDPSNIIALRALDRAIVCSEETLNELKNEKVAAESCTDENDYDERSIFDIFSK